MFTHHFMSDMSLEQREQTEHSCSTKGRVTLPTLLLKFLGGYKEISVQQKLEKLKNSIDEDKQR